jgi:molecular chaperone DnaK
MAPDNKTLGKFILDGIPPAPRGAPQVEVTFDIDANGILDVKAKDRATGRGQQVRITASSMLSKEDVDRMVRDAKDHADEDRQRRDEVETRNQSDALAFQAERTLRDLGDKVEAADRAEAERRLGAVREALKGSDLGAIRSAASALTEQLQKVATAAYAKSGPIDYETPAGDGATGDGSGAAGDGSGAAAGDGEGTSPGTGGESDEAVEGEYKEV